MTRPDEQGTSEHWWALVIGEEVYFLSGKNEWQIGTVTGTTGTGRSYNIPTHEGTSLRRNRSHLKPRSHDIPIISQNFTSRTSTSSPLQWIQCLWNIRVISSISNAFDNKLWYSFQKIFHFGRVLLIMVLKGIIVVIIVKIFHFGRVLWSGKPFFCYFTFAIKPKKQTRFAHQTVTSDQCQDHSSKENKTTSSQMDHQCRRPRLADTIRELSQARADMNLNKDLRGNLSVMSPRESHHTEEKILPTVPLGQFQAQRSDNITTNSIAHSDIATPYQSEIKSDQNNSSTITKNIVPCETNTFFQREIFSGTGTGTSSSKDMTHSDADMSEEAAHQTGTKSKHEEANDNSCTSKTTTSSQSEIFSSYNNSSDCETYTSSQSEITEYDANSE